MNQTWWWWWWSSWWCWMDDTITVEVIAIILMIASINMNIVTIITYASLITFINYHENQTSSPLRHPFPNTWNTCKIDWLEGEKIQVWSESRKDWLLGGRRRDRLFGVIRTISADWLMKSKKYILYAYIVINIHVYKHVHYLLNHLNQKPFHTSTLEITNILNIPASWSSPCSMLTSRRVTTETPHSSRGLMMKCLIHDQTVGFPPQTSHFLGFGTQKATIHFFNSD